MRPTRFSKRGCMPQMSRMSVTKRRWMASWPVCFSSTMSMAVLSAAIACSPSSRSLFQRCSTWCHSSAANRKPGDTGLPACTRRSVLSSASCTKRWPIGCSSATSSSGSRPLCRPALRSSCSEAQACPDISSFSISSNRRALGTLWISGASSAIGSRVASSIEKPVLAAKRTTRSMRTGSSR
ncbi:hypothetical protein D3C72_1319820 [compost metagenome]